MSAWTEWPSACSPILAVNTEADMSSAPACARPVSPVTMLLALSFVSLHATITTTPEKRSDHTPQPPLSAVPATMGMFDA